LTGDLDAPDERGVMILARLRGGTGLIPTAMFFGSFAWSFVFVSLPFHIQAISTGDESATLRWTGWIVGITSLVSVVTNPLWGRLAGRRNPKVCYVLVEGLQGIGFFGLAIARTLLELFVARLVLGFMGASSTFAFMLAGRTGDPAEVRRQVALVQTAMMVGGVIGPLAGAVVAVRFGFRASFVIGAFILLGCAGFVAWAVSVPAVAAVARPDARRLRVVDVLVSAAIVLAGSVHLFFLAPVLPQVLPRLGVTDSDTVEVGGVVIFASSAAAALGGFAAPLLARLASERRLVALLLAGSSLLLGALGLLASVWAYTVVRFLQVLCIAPVFPLVVARIAQHAGGDVIGIVNSARIGASFVGPVIATSILASAPPAVVYLVLAAGGLACVPLLALHGPEDRVRPTALPPAPR
jgi:MFS transporter, DHA1 family, multidrug resistance protein